MNRTAIVDYAHTPDALKNVLETVRDIYDEVLLLKRRSIAFGPVGEVFTEENLETSFGPVEQSGKEFA